MGPESLGYFLLGIILFFILLIWFLLIERKKFLSQLDSMSADEVWSQCAHQNFSRDDLIFGYPKDIKASEAALVIKNYQNEKVALSRFPMGARERSIEVGERCYHVKHPSGRMYETAHLYSEDGNRIIAQFNTINFLGDHHFEIPNVGILKVKRSWSFKRIFRYQLNEEWIGFSQEISAVRKKGRILVLPATFPIELRVFILSP